MRHQSATLLAAALLAALVAPGPARAEALPTPPRPRYAMQQVGADQGFATRTPTALYQDRAGFLWIGTHDALYRYDGGEFREFGVAEGVPRALVGQIVESPSGEMIVANTKGLLRGNGQRFDALAVPGTTVTIGEIQLVAFDKAGHLYVACADGLYRAEGLPAPGLTELAARRVWPAAGQAGHPVSGVYVDGASGTVWFTLAARLARWLGEPRGAEFLDDAGLPDDAFRAVLADGDGRVWVRTNRHIARRDPGSATFVADDTGVPASNDVGGPALDGRGNLLVPTVLGLFRKTGDGDTWENIDKSRGAPSSSPTVVLEDREGALWIGFGGAGVARWPGPDRWSAWSEEEGLPNEVAWSSVRDAANRLWVATNDGLAMWDPARPAAWRYWNEKDGLAGPMVRRLALAADGSVWCSSVPGGVTRIDGGTLAARRIPIPGLAADGSPWGMSARDGSVAVLTPSGVWELDASGAPHSASRLAVPAEIAPNGVRSIQPAPGGVLWAAGRNGIGRWDGAAWRLFTPRDRLRGSPVGNLASDSADHVWFSYRDAPGVSKLDLPTRGAPRVRHFTTAEGLSSDSLYFLGVDSLGQTWCGGAFGVSVIAVDGSVRNYNHADGLIWDDCSDEGFRAEPDGVVWIGTSRGLARFDPRGERRTLPPTVVITSATFGGKTPTTAAPEIEWSDRLFAASFAGLTFRDPSKVRFRYRLAGLEEEWNETGLRQARYPALPAGAYRFEVEARSAAGVWSSAPASYAFAVLPPWWQTGPFRTAVVLFVGALAFFAYRARVARLVAAKNQLEVVVAERTSLLDQRNQDLAGAIGRLKQAQRQILQLQEQSDGDPKNLLLWSTRMAGEIAEMVGVPEIGVWAIERDQVVSLAPSSLPPPTLAQVEETHGIVREGRGEEGPTTLVPILGPAGEPRGALVVPTGLSSWGETERQLLDSFARHLGATLGLQQMRERLMLVEAERSRTLWEMQERGFDTLQECPRCGRCYDQNAKSCEAEGAELVRNRVLPVVVAERFRLTRNLGEGGMGTVFLARDERLDRLVAVKIIRAELLNDLVMRRRFEREARTVARIQHPGVVAVFDSGELPFGSAYLVMEYLNGLDLEQVLLRFGPGSPEQVARVLEQVGEALAAAHRLGVVHRDLKPANLFLVPAAGSFQAKVLDFGLAKTLGEGTVTQSGIYGSPAYMSPEQIREEQLDPRSDLYSLATVAYELLTGVQVHAAGSVGEILNTIMNAAPAPLADHMPEIPRELEEAFAEAFAKQPQQRPASVMAWVARAAPLIAELRPDGSGWPLHDIFREASHRSLSGTPTIPM